jgi:hypothetical protein
MDPETGGTCQIVLHGKYLLLSRLIFALLPFVCTQINTGLLEIAGELIGATWAISSKFIYEC